MRDKQLLAADVSSTKEIIYTWEKQIFSNSRFKILYFSDCAAADIIYLSLYSWSFHPQCWPTVGSFPGVQCWQSSLPSPYSGPRDATSGEREEWVSTVRFWMRSLGVSVFDHSYLLGLLFLKAHVFNCSNQKSLCPVSSENHYKQFIFWLSWNWTDPDSDISSVYQPVIVGYSSTLEVQQLTGVNLASVPWVLSAGGSCVCHVNNVIAGHGQRSVWAGGEGHVDTYVEGVSGWWLTALQLLKQHLIVCTDTG